MSEEMLIGRKFLSFVMKVKKKILSLSDLKIKCVLQLLSDFFFFIYANILENNVF